MPVVDWNKETAFLLGRQFALYELIELASRGAGFHGRMMTNLYQAAASEPRRIFPLLEKRCAIHLARFGDNQRRIKSLLKAEVAKIKGCMPTGDYDSLPALLSEKQDVLFAAGYCYQRNELFGASDGAANSSLAERSAPDRRLAQGGRHAPRVCARSEDFALKAIA